MYTVVVIGLGLIGGSIAKALHANPKITEIIGIDANQQACEMALTEGVIQNHYSKPCKEAVQDADLIFFCTPVDFIIPLLEQTASYIPAHCILTDVGSTKNHVVGEIHRLFPHLHFIGGHPMAGSEKAGYEASFPALFQGCYYILTPSPDTPYVHLSLLKDLVASFGATPIIYDSQTHDFCTAGISHVPHILAAGFVNLIKALDAEGCMSKIASTGFKDFTRIGASNPNIWSQITLQNKENILFFLKEYHTVLQSFEEELRKENQESIYKFFDSSKNFRDSFK